LFCVFNQEKVFPIDPKLLKAVVLEGKIKDNSLACDGLFLFTRSCLRYREPAHPPTEIESAFPWVTD